MNNQSTRVDATQPVVVPQEAQLARHRDPGLPPVRVVTVMLQSDRWAAVDVELPFAEVNDVLGVQLERTIVSGVHFEVTQI